MAHSPFDIYRLLLVIFVSLYALTALAGMLWSRGSRVASRGVCAGVLRSCARTRRRDLVEIAGLAVVLALLVIVQL